MVKDKLRGFAGADSFPIGKLNLTVSAVVRVFRCAKFASIVKS